MATGARGSARAHYQEAQELRTRFEDRTALLDQLGWAQQDSRDKFAITLDPTRFESVIGQLRWDTTAILANSTMPGWQDHEAADIARQAFPVYGAINVQLLSAGSQPCACEAGSAVPHEGSTGSEQH